MVVAYSPKISKEVVMIVYIFRHAEALEASEALRDEWRYLTDKGRKSAVSLARRLASHGLKSCSIVSSPLVRAVQTAQIVADTCGAKCTVEINGLLQPGGDIPELIHYLRSRTDKNVMLVGHEPQLGTLTAALLQHKDTIQLKKSSCIILEIKHLKPAQAATFLTYRVAGKNQIKSFKKALEATRP